MDCSFTIVFSAIFGAVILASARPFRKNPNLRTITADQFSALRGARQGVYDNGCAIRLCLALDGSGSVTPAQFQSQKDFVDIVIKIIAIDEPQNLAAVQYGTSIKPISPLTINRNKFFKSLRRAKPVGGLSNLAGALGYCGFQLRRRKNIANKLIIIGNGYDYISIRPKTFPKGLGDGIGITAVAVGPSDVEGLVSITGDKNRVVRIKDFFDIGEIVVGVINDICG